MSTFKPSLEIMLIFLKKKMVFCRCVKRNDIKLGHEAKTKNQKTKKTKTLLSMSYARNGHPRITEGLVLCSLFTTDWIEVSDFMMGPASC